MSDVQIVKTCEALRQTLAMVRGQQKTVGLVPTMGALHAGHLSLVARSRELTDFTVVTIYVNPTQFAPSEDLAEYPAPIEKDIALLAEIGVDLVFLPSTEEMYPAGCTSVVMPPAVSKSLEGESRPSHFEGVCTIVLKFFNLVQPDKAFFGQKDYQQLATIRQMTTDLNVAVEVEGCPIVRDPDGLAMSSRNVYLSEDERLIALSLSQTLELVKKSVLAGETDSHMLMAEMRQALIDAGVTSLDYAVLVEPNTLRVVDEVQSPVVALIAAHVGTTRLIDNCVIGAK